MLPCRLPRFSSRRTRQFLTALALAAYVLSVVGYPLPLAAKRDVSTPFPCQDHQCGCHSAEQCWESCCCYTPKERLAWARRHGVSLSREVRLAMAGPACDEHEHAGGESCCARDEDHHGAADDGCETCRQEQSGRTIGFVFGFQAQKCRGLTTLWMASGATVPVAIHSRWEFEWMPLGRVCPTACEFTAPFSRPPVPPPRWIAESAPLF